MLRRKINSLAPSATSLRRHFPSCHLISFGHETIQRPGSAAVATIRRTSMRNLAKNRITIAGLRRLLRSTLFRLALLSAIVFLVLFKVALPQFVSTASVKTNMENALSSWTGGRASISGDPTISFWPRPQLTLHDVTIVSDGANPQLMARADAITADFDVLAALRGIPVFYDFRLLAPVFRIERLKDDALNWRRAGWMADAMRSKPDHAPVLTREVPIGDIAIENGALDIIDNMSGSVRRIANISGMVTWPTPSEQVRIDLSAMVKGKSSTGPSPVTTPCRSYRGGARRLTRHFFRAFEFGF
ncbi:AsmA family protein [Rhizobium sp. 32-5/1]|uniref:AsmA family protein n=1 Tax=Rhizobium sp. 32-5/1 TaxID=3019602 RepID=UPI00240DFEDC|nr:AsmA family protein [Rhizobium sp. 32-5/1]WEZ84354.1 AsmA family protein [Rhizobium sp. 32-5/1]